MSFFFVCRETMANQKHQYWNLKITSLELCGGIITEGTEYFCPSPPARHRSHSGPPGDRLRRSQWRTGEAGGSPDGQKEKQSLCPLCLCGNKYFTVSAITTWFSVDFFFDPACHSTNHIIFHNPW
jgi:hypothetical protein